MDVFKKIVFVRFCFASATMLPEDLGLSTEKLICLYKECTEMAKHSNDMTIIITFVRFCFASASMLQENLGLPTEKLICLYNECIEMAKHCNDIDTMVDSGVEFALHSNSIGRHADSLRCLKEIIPSAVAIPMAELVVHQCLSSTYGELREFDYVVLHTKKWIEIARNLGDKEKEMDGHNEMGKAFLLSARYDDAIDCFKRSFEIAQEIGSTEDEMMAYRCIMGAYKCMQKHDGIILYAHKLLDCSMKTSNQKAMQTAYLELGRAHLALKHHKDATDYGKKCIEIARETKDRSGEVWTYHLMGRVYEALSDYDNAIIYCKKCIELAITIGNKYAEALACSFIGGIYRSLGKYDDAISNCNKCLRIEKEYNTEKAADATAYFTLGKVNQALQKYDEAIQNFRQCIAIVKSIGLEKQAGLRACMYLGEIYETLKQYDDAVHYYKKCIDMAQETGEKMIEAQECLVLSSLYFTLDEKDNAIPYGKKCIFLAQETGDKKTEMEGHHLLAQVYLDLMQLKYVSLSIDAGMAIAIELGDKEMEEKFKEICSGLYITVGMYDKAREVPYVKEIAEVSTCSEEDLLEECDQAVKAGDKKKKYRAFGKLYKFYLAKLDYEKAISYLEQIKEMDVGQSVNLFCFTNIGHLYQLMVQNDKALRCYEEGLPTAESCSNNEERSRFYYGFGRLFFLSKRELTLAERYLREAIRCFEAIFTTLGRHDDFKISIFDQYIHSYKMLAILLIKGKHNNEALLVLDRCRARALKDLMISNYKMEQEGSDDEHLNYSDVFSLVISRNDFSILYYSLCYDVFFSFFLGGETTLHFSRPPNRIRINDFLRIYVDTLFDEIGVREVVNCEDRSLDEEQDIRKEQKRCIEDHEKLDQATASLLNLDSKGGESNENSSETKGSALEVLFQILECDRILSLEQDEVVIIPEGPLYQVPFPALRDPRTGKYLSETKRIRLAPSLATLKHFEDFPTDRTSNVQPLIIGDPLVGKVMMDGEERYIIPLPGAREEAERISKLLNTPALLKEQATKLAVIKRLQEGVSVVHIAAHGILSKATIVLAPSTEIRATKPIPDEEDYMLTMADVQLAKVRAQLVVLSCCHSGRGEITAEGVVGMCRAFLVSGARAVVASLWAIEDSATLTFMKIFYGFLKNGKSASTSLQLTMNEMRNTTDYKEPKYWAPFFYMGDDVTLQL